MIIRLLILAADCSSVGPAVCRILGGIYAAIAIDAAPSAASCRSARQKEGLSPPRGDAPLRAPRLPETVRFPGSIVALALTSNRREIRVDGLSIHCRPVSETREPPDTGMHPTLDFRLLVCTCGPSSESLFFILEIKGRDSDEFPSTTKK